MAKASKRKLIKALKTSMGNISAAARNLGMARSYISQVVNSDPELLQIAVDARESMVDNAESALSLAVNRGEAWAVCFLLKTQGKNRGYVERVETKAESKVTVSMRAEELTDDDLAAIATSGGDRITSAAESPIQPD
jgi:hypothetical protein